MLSFETCNYLKKQRKGKVGRMTLKVDMSKALIGLNGNI